tara:strand:- start:2849 stop:3520 length:672 start_codon:yes stop_codon:yes gene_type:complete
MATINQAVSTYEGGIENAISGFQQDIEELEEEGLSTAEILGIIAAIDFTSYFIEDLRFSAPINTFMATTETILSDLPFFGATSEVQLVALQTLQRQGIEGVTRSVANTMQKAMASGISSGLKGEQLKNAIRSSIKTNIPRVENVIGTLLGDYRRSVVTAMSIDLPKNTLYAYIGPDDDKNRAVCRTFLANDPLTREEIREVKSDGFEHGGGTNCRHYFSPINV